MKTALFSSNQTCGPHVLRIIPLCLKQRPFLFISLQIKGFEAHLAEVKQQLSSSETYKQDERVNIKAGAAEWNSCRKSSKRIILNIYIQRFVKFFLNCFIARFSVRGRSASFIFRGPVCLFQLAGV